MCAINFIFYRFLLSLMIYSSSQFLFGAKVHEVSQLRDKPARGVSIQFMRVVR